jgi:biopolymer transport protein ExbB
MDMMKRVESLMVTLGPSPVTWLMLGLSGVSVAIILERSWFFRSIRDDVDALAHALKDRLGAADYEGARGMLEASPAPEAAVVATGLAHARHGADAAAEAMAGASARERARLERRLAFLGTLGSNAPFVGLFGTVIAIVAAFERLGAQAAPGAIMGTIGEALVATAVGLGVAMPSVAAFNAFQRQIRLVGSNTEVLSRILLAHLREDRGSRTGGM